MEFGVLGPLRMTAQRISYVPTAPKQRQLLALLLFNANQVVSTSACIEELWESAPPASALSTLQTYVLQLRRALRGVPHIGSLQDARKTLETRDGGYLLVVRPGELDLHVFERLVSHGRAALDHDDDRTGSRLLGEALDMWTGAALADVQTGPILQSYLTGLEEQRICVQEQRIEADLRLGHHHELLGELSALVTQNPTHENLHAQLMLALYRSGRPAQALTVHRRLRQVLHDELGLEPSPRMRRLHQAVLACDPVLDMPSQARGRLSLDLPARAG